MVGRRDVIKWGWDLSGMGAALDIVRDCKKPEDFESLHDNEHYVEAFEKNVENKLFEKYTGKKAADLAEAALKAMDKDADGYLDRRPGSH